MIRIQVISGRVISILTMLIGLAGYGCGSHDRNDDPEAGQINLRDSIWFEYFDVTGIGYVKDVSRRDPSDIIREGSQYYIWYTKIPANTGGKRTALYNSGYYGTIWYATSSDGYA